jgi:hypothetical protein
MNEGFTSQPDVDLSHLPLTRTLICKEELASVNMASHEGIQSHLYLQYERHGTQTAPTRRLRGFQGASGWTVSQMLWLNVHAVDNTHQADLHPPR